MDREKLEFQTFSYENEAILFLTSLSLLKHVQIIAEGYREMIRIWE